MYINTFKYTPKDVSCQLCTEYVKKLGCTALRCPWLAERIEAGVVGYREAVMKFSDCRFSLIFRAFLHFQSSVVLFLNHRNRCFLIGSYLMERPIHHSKKFLWFIIFHFRIDVHSCFAIFMPCKILNRLGVHPRIEEVRDVGMPELMRRHIKIYRVFDFGIVLLLHPQRWLDGVPDALPVDIFIVGSLFGGSDHYILPDPLKLRIG